MGHPCACLLRAQQPPPSLLHKLVDLKTFCEIKCSLLSEINYSQEPSAFTLLKKYLFNVYLVFQ